MSNAPECFEFHQVDEQLGHGLPQDSVAGVDDQRLLADNVVSGLELGVFDGCAQWALGRAIGAVLCGRDERQR
jgi:hypothetical protein